MSSKYLATRAKDATARSRTLAARSGYFAVGVIVSCVLTGAARGQAGSPSTHKVMIDWGKTVLVSQSTPTLQVVVNPMLRASSPIHDSAFEAVKKLGANDVRYVPWLPYPRLAVAELKPPTATTTSWDFSLIDPMTKDFLAATDGHPTVMNFSTIPAWLFKTKQPVTYPKDPDQADWNYTQGTQLVDPSGKQLGDYYARLVSWYTRGGFTDELGKVHTSGYHYTFPIWEVLNEVDFEHETTPEQYTRRYDAIVSAIHQVSPETKFMALALAAPQNSPEWFEYFLNHANHKAGIPLDYISYHFYALPSPSETIDDWQYTFFDQADRFLTDVRFIDAIRQRLSPETKTDTDELGVILPNDNELKAELRTPMPPLYWNVAGALYGYLFIGLSRQKIDIIGESQLVGYPSQYPSVTMINWKTGKPNARYWVLKIIKDNFHPGDRLVQTGVGGGGQVEGQAFATPEGKKLLLVNKRNRPAEIALPKAQPYVLTVVDGQTGDNPPRVSQGSDPTFRLGPFAVAVVSFQ
ncbi:MAG: GH39 family glycosyl hydrolase [Acidobacteriaceae bacterium]